MKSNYFSSNTKLAFLCLFSTSLLGSCQLMTKIGLRKDHSAHTTTVDTTKKDSVMAYAKIAKDAKIDSGIFNILSKGKDYYFEIPLNKMDKDFLLINKISSVPLALNEAGLNKGMNFENKVLRFTVKKTRNEVWVGEAKPQVEVPRQDAIAKSVADNFTQSFIESFKIESYNADSSAVLIKVNKVFDGTEKSFNDVFTNLGLGTSPKSSLSNIEQIKSFRNNVVVRSILSTKVTEGNESVPISLTVTSNIYELPDNKMKARFADPRVGYFTTARGIFRMRSRKWKNGSS